MKITCNRNDLVNAMKVILRAIPKRTTNPYLECVLIETDGNIIKLTSNDMEVAINTVLEGRVVEHGAIAIDANMLSNIAGKLPNGEVLISTTDGKSVTVKAEKSKFTIPCKSPDGFVGFPAISNGIDFMLPQAELKAMILGVAFCSDLASQNAMMAGCNLEVDGDVLSLTALDGHRVAIRRAKMISSVEKTSAIIPTRTLTDISKVLSDKTDMVHMSITKANIVFQFGNTVMLSRLIEGNYFDISRMFGSQPTTRVTVSGSDFINCVNRSTVLLRESDKKPLILEVTDGNMHFSTQSNMGSASEDLEIDKQGDDLRVGYNPRFLLDALNAIEYDNVEMKMCGSRGPAFFSDDDDMFIYVILPVNI